MSACTMEVLADHVSEVKGKRSNQDVPIGRLNTITCRIHSRHGGAQQGKRIALHPSLRA